MTKSYWSFWHRFKRLFLIATQPLPHHLLECYAGYCFERQLHWRLLIVKIPPNCSLVRAAGSARLVLGSVETSQRCVPLTISPFLSSRISYHVWLWYILVLLCRFQHFHRSIAPTLDTKSITHQLEIVDHFLMHHPIAEINIIKLAPLDR